MTSKVLCFSFSIGFFLSFSASAQQEQLPLAESPNTAVREVRIIPDSSSKSGEAVKNLVSSADQAVRNRDYSTAAQLLEQVVSIDPNYKNAWNYLGWTYNALGKYEKAEQALRKAVSVNPSDPQAYNNLGQALAFQKRYDDAIQQYLKQIEVRPRDPWAHANLGRVYILTKHYEKAIPELNTASEISPNDASILFNLGFAYAKLHQPEKSVQAFEKSIELQPVPARWNSVSYALADEKLDLQKAEKYSLASIAAAAGQMRDTSLDRVTREDISLATRIAAYWDTWGWIRFQEGNFSEANKYVRSAWMLYPSAVIINHMGQLSEKNGKKDDAAHFYQMALATSPTHEDSRNRLVALVGSDKNVDQLVDEGRRLLQDTRTITIHNSHNSEGFAEFWVLLSPGPTVGGVKFASGDEDLRAFAKDLETADFPNCFPDATEIRLVRRARLSCTNSSSQCRLQFIAPQDIPAEVVPAATPSVAGGLRLQIGGDVSAAKLLNKVPPVYPALARQQRIQGLVQLKVIIGADGAVQQLEIVSGHPTLLQAAIDAVRQWKYQPTLLEGKPVEVETTIDVYFQLQ